MNSTGCEVGWRLLRVSAARKAAAGFISPVPVTNWQVGFGLRTGRLHLRAMCPDATSNRCEVELPLRVVVTGVAGVPGEPLIRTLRSRGHHVTALHAMPEPAAAGDAATDDRESADDGAPPDDRALADPTDVGRLTEVLRRAAPDVVVHFGPGFDIADRGESLLARARALEPLAANLATAAARAGAGRVVVRSSIAAYAPQGHDVLDEDAPLWPDAPEEWGAAVRALAALEESALTRSDVEGVSVRLGALYGPGTQFAPGGALHDQVRGSALPLVEDGAGLMSFTHVDDAVRAVADLVSAGEPGAYNVVDNEPAEFSEWLPAYARMLGGPAPVALTLDQAVTQLDWLTVHQLTEQRGASNFRLREALGWRPSWPSWREGLADMFGLWPG